MKAKGDTPERRCIVSGEVRPKEELIRCVVGPDEVVVPDVDNKLPGRGMWLTATRETIEKACKKNAFSRAARQQVKPMAGLADQIETLLVRRCMSHIGLMRRSNNVIYGFEKTRGWLKEGRCVCIVAARDGAEDGRSKVKALARDLPVYAVLDAAEMGQAVGREHLVHMGFANGPLADRFEVDARRLQGFRVEREN